MRIKVGWICVLLATMSLIGCLTRRIDLLDKGIVVVESRPTQGFTISPVYVHQEGGVVVVEGKIRRYHPSALTSSGHIDVVILSPDGTIMGRKEVFYLPRIVPRKGRQESLFTARFILVPPPGSRIFLSHHHP